MVSPYIHRLRMMETCDVRTFRKRRRFRACRRPSRRWRPNWTRSRTDLRKQAPNSRIPRNSCKRSVNKTSATHLRCARKQQEIQLKASEVGCTVAAVLHVIRRSQIEIGLFTKCTKIPVLVNTFCERRCWQNRQKDRI